MAKDIESKIAVAATISDYLSVVRDRGFILTYRGQAEDWPLIPSIGRVDLTVSDGLLEIEEDILQKLKLYGYPIFKDDVQNYSDWILHAQHYGLPSRLLDFTTNPLKALYFAVEASPNADGIVWGVDEYGDAEFPSLDIVSAEFYRPTHINSRITAQESVFAVFPLHRNTLEMEPLKKYLHPNTPIVKIKIPAKCKPEIKSELSILGINKMTMYPGIEGVVEKVKEECGLL